MRNRDRAAWAFAGLVALIIGLAAVAVLIIALVAVGNADFQGRFTETVVTHRPSVATDVGGGVPTVRLVLRRVISDQNVMEASIIIEAPPDVAERVAQGGLELAAEVSDASTYGSEQLVAGRAILSSRDAAGSTSRGAAVESDAFTLPALPSVEGFPFDELRVHPHVRLIGVENENYVLEIQRAFPGRQLRASGTTYVDIVLHRTLIEQVLAIAGSAVFLGLSLVLIVSMLRGDGRIRGVDRYLAVAAFVLAAAGFREFVGVSRTTGGTVLEVLVFGVPLCAVGAVAAIGMLRDWRQPDHPSRESAS